MSSNSIAKGLELDPCPPLVFFTLMMALFPKERASLSLHHSENAGIRSLLPCWARKAQLHYILQVTIALAGQSFLPAI